jgi:hypothetical protein
MNDIARTDTENLLENWRTRAHRSKIAHYKSANRFGRRHVLLGVPVVLLTVGAGTAVFATLKERPDAAIQITVGLVSIPAAILASLQTFLDYSGRAAKHRVAAAKYGSVQREIEEISLFRPGETRILQTEVAAIRRRMDELAESRIDCPQDIWRKADAEVLRLHPKGVVSPGKTPEPTS